MSIIKKIIISNAVMLTLPVLIMLVITGVIAMHSGFLLKDINFFDWGSIIDSLSSKYGLHILVWGIVVSAVVNATLTFYLSKSIIRPIKELKDGTYNIINGNLNFEIAQSDYKEINELCIAFDDMRMKMKESALKQIRYEHDRNMLIANISHDLKTPITSIKGYAEGILDGIAQSPDKLEKYIRTIHGKAVIIEQLVDNLSLFSKLNLKDIPFNLVATDLISILKELIETCSLDAQQHGVNILLNAKQDSYIVAVDREKIYRVFHNLIENSIKYKSKTISIALTDISNGIITEFCDDGTGISPDSLPFVFDSFYRSDPARNSTIKGNGLGLSISKQIVETHKGKIWIKSSENIGTSVFIFLPKNT